MRVKVRVYNDIYINTWTKNKLCHACEWVVPRARMSRGTSIRRRRLTCVSKCASRTTYIYIYTNINKQIRYGTRTNDSCHPYKWIVAPHPEKSVQHVLQNALLEWYIYLYTYNKSISHAMSRTWMRYVTRTKKPWHLIQQAACDMRLKMRV